MGRREPPRVTLAQIEDARRRIQGVAWRTPIVPASRDERDIFVKLECLQRTGSFKVRGAWNRMSRATVDERRKGFVTASAGNHGQAVAWCARELGAPCTVYVPDDAVARKVRAIESMGAKIVRRTHEDVMQSMADGRLETLGMTFIHPFGDPLVVAGQGTIGLEIAEDVQDLRSLVVPVGGGGLITGIATAVRARNPGVRVYGVQAEGSAPLVKTMATRKPEHVGSPQTIADGIGASMTFDYMVPVLLENLVGAFVVSDEEMKAAMKHLLHETRAVAEPAGASSLAAAWRYRDELEEPIVCVVSGGNADPVLLAEILKA